MTYKPLWEEEKRKREELEKEFARQVERLSDLKAVEKIKEEQEKFRKAQEGFENDYAELKLNLEKELAHTKKTIKNIQMNLEPLQKLKEALREILPTPSTGTLSSGPLVAKETIDLEHKELVVNIHDEGEEVVKMSTNTKEGQILYCAVNDLPKEGWTVSEMDKALTEHGWNIKSSTLGAKLSIFTGEAKLVKTEKGYRLPTKVKFNIIQ